MPTSQGWELDAGQASYWLPPEMGGQKWGGGGVPATVAEALARVVNEVRQKQALPPIPVHFGMRNWKPFIAEAVSRLSRAYAGALSV